MPYSPPRQRAISLDVTQRRHAASVIAPHARKFDTWLKEVSLLGAIRLSQAATPTDLDRTSGRLAEIAEEVQASYSDFRTTTQGIEGAGRVEDLENAYSRLLTVLEGHNA